MPLRPNPAYGTGIFRRRLRLVVEEQAVRVDLEDSNHAFRLLLRHDGRCIGPVEVDFVRHPFTTCPEAGAILGHLPGRPLDGRLDVRRTVGGRAGCTHVADMAAIALAHVRETGLTRLYDVAVPDETHGRQRASIACDGSLVHDWFVDAHALVEPARLAGRPLLQGFAAWARVSFTGMHQEAAFALQRGYFVAQARRYDTSPEREHPALADGMPDGVCYSYSAPAVQRAERIEGSKRDFTADAAGLLRFGRR